MDGITLLSVEKKNLILKYWISDLFLNKQLKKEEFG